MGNTIRRNIILIIATLGVISGFGIGRQFPANSPAICVLGGD